MRHTSKGFSLVSIAFFGLLLSLFVSPLQSFAAPARVQSTQKATTTCLQPPQNVDLTTLSDAELQSYGLPSQVSIKSNPQKWAQALPHAKHRICGSSPSTHKYRSSSPKSLQNTTTANASLASGPLTLSGNQSSSNWAGNIAQGSRGTYKTANMDFYVPAVTFPTSNSAVTFWAGVGGVPALGGGNAMLVQAGVFIDSNGHGGQYNESFWEIYPYNDAQNLPLNRLNVGDHVYADAESNVGNNNENFFYIENITTNYYNSYSMAGGPFSDSATGECIVERPGYNGGNTDLAHFNPNSGSTEAFNYCTIGTNSSSAPIGNWSHFYYTMYNSNGIWTDTLAYPGPISNGGYNYLVYWKAAN